MAFFLYSRIAGKLARAENDLMPGSRVFAILLGLDAAQIKIPWLMIGILRVTL